MRCSAFLKVFNTERMNQAFAFRRRGPPHTGRVYRLRTAAFEMHIYIAVLVESALAEVGRCTNFIKSTFFCLT